MKRAFIVAMECEAEAIRPALRDGDRIYVCGIGKVNAAMAARQAVCEGAELLLNAGVCGGFGADVDVGGVYEVRAAVEYDFDLAAVNGTRVGQLDECDTPFLPAATFGVHPAKILATGDHFNDSEHDYALICDELGAELRDMEGAAVAHVACRCGVKFAALKAVTNVAGQGSMTGQYRRHRAAVLARLSAALPAWLEGMAAAFV